uniref:Uncharacterized protein n=1 Tax=Tanacetum cinerariifolium TaxID=118510 RepID=A0A6L2KST1_TANCI|nr:hypothetical protein [Tanacetum cinerariifolium]
MLWMSVSHLAVLDGGQYLWIKAFLRRSQVLIAIEVSLSTYLLTDSVRVNGNTHSSTASCDTLGILKKTYNVKDSINMIIGILILISGEDVIKNSHDPLALVAPTGSSSRIPSPYYVTHPSSVVDYDDDYQGDVFQTNSKDPLTFAMMLLARAITQRFSNPTNNHLCTSSNTKIHAIVQADKVNIQSKNSGNDAINTRRSYVHEEIIKGNNVHNDAGNTQRILRTMSSGSTVRKVIMLVIVQSQKFKIQRPSYDSASLTEVQQPSTNYVNPLFAKDNQEQKYLKQPKIINDTIGDNHIDSNIIFNEPSVDVNSGSVEYDNNVQTSYALEQLAINAYKEAEK